MVVYTGRSDTICNAPCKAMARYLDLIHKLYYMTQNAEAQGTSNFLYGLLYVQDHPCRLALGDQTLSTPHMERWELEVEGSMKLMGETRALKRKRTMIDEDDGRSRPMRSQEQKNYG